MFCLLTRFRLLTVQRYEEYGLLPNHLRRLPPCLSTFARFDKYRDAILVLIIRKTAQKLSKSAKKKRKDDDCSMKKCNFAT